MSPRFIAVRHWGSARRYAVMNTGAPLGWITGPGQRFGSYRLKRDAARRAAEYNAADAEGRL